MIQKVHLLRTVTLNPILREDVLVLFDFANFNKIKNAHSQGDPAPLIELLV